MSDPHRPQTAGTSRWGAGSTESSTTAYPPYVDPAYASQLPTYGTEYPPSTGSASTTQSSGQRWAPNRPPGGPDDGGKTGPPEPPRFPRWLFLLASAAVLLVVALVIALVITNGSTKKSATVTPVSPLPSMPSMPTTPAPTTRIPTSPTELPAPTAPTIVPPTEPTSPGIPQNVVYTVTGQGRAISIAYIDTGGVLQTEFNVVLPWSKQVSLTPPASTAASVTVVNIGEQVTCSVSVDGTQVRQRTGTILTICAGSR